MNEPDTVIGYPEREVRAVHAVLMELGQVLGSWRDKFVIVGGAVPWLLLEGAKPEHIGTTDIDLDLDPCALTDGEYATLIEALEQKGYERGSPDLKPFQLRRTVRVDNGSPIGVLVDLLMPRNARGDGNKEKLVEGLRVQRADGCDIALDNWVMKTLEGKMPDGRDNSVTVQIATIPALLVMKGYALVGRDKKKDSYDIYYSVRHYVGGTPALSAECAKLIENAVARIGFGHIAGKFRHSDDFGPVTVRKFLEESDALGGMTPDQVQTDAYMRVFALLKDLKLV